jgi:hypothetical protein
MSWIELAQGRNQWRVLLNIVMKFRFHKMFGSSRVAARLAVSQEGSSSTKLVRERSIQTKVSQTKRQE